MTANKRVSNNIARALCCGALLAPIAVIAADFAGRTIDAAAHYRRMEQYLQVPDAILTDPSGKSFSLAQELGAEGPVVLNFISTSCGDECAEVTRTYADLRVRSGPKLRRLRIISIAADPRRDTPARWRAYARQVGAGPDWMLLTGSSRELNPVLEAFGTAGGQDFRAPRTTFLHAGPNAAWVRLDGLVSPADLLTELR